VIKASERFGNADKRLFSVWSGMTHFKILATFIPTGQDAWVATYLGKDKVFSTLLHDDEALISFVLGHGDRTSELLDGTWIPVNAGQVRAS
jgi:hypothetical protein